VLDPAKLPAEPTRQEGKGHLMRCSEIRGFNYDGSWGTSGLDLWQHHDNGAMAVELARGKKYFPGWNMARWWLSQDAFQRSPDRFVANFDAGLRLFEELGIQVIPVLFNRWRDPVCDFGGVALDHIIGGFSVFSADPEPFVGVSEDDGPPNSVQALFRRYLGDVVGGFRDDPRIFAWDLCNEPLMGPYVEDPASPVRQGELKWLTWCHDVCKSVGATQPLTIGNYPKIAPLELTEPISDILSFHPYYQWNAGGDGEAEKLQFEAYVDACVAVAEKAGKELLASETVWGAEDDGKHVEIIRYTLGVLSARRIGFTVHALHHSLVADLHHAPYGPVGPPGCLQFINPDGSLRVGHEVFNEFV
jgi:hypothetical protein